MGSSGVVLVVVVFFSGFFFFLFSGDLLALTTCMCAFLGTWAGVFGVAYSGPISHIRPNANGSCALPFSC